MSVDTWSHPFPPRCHLNIFPARNERVCMCLCEEGNRTTTNWGVIGPSGPKSIPKAPHSLSFSPENCIVMCERRACQCIVSFFVGGDVTARESSPAPKATHQSKQSEWRTHEICSAAQTGVFCSPARRRGRSAHGTPPTHAPCLSTHARAKKPFSKTLEISSCQGGFVYFASKQLF